MLMQGFWEEAGQLSRALGELAEALSQNLKWAVCGCSFCFCAEVTGAAVLG